MSFRIDDILKKDANNNGSEQNHKCVKNDNSSPVFSTNSSSILQKTLQRPNFQYHRSLSEPYSCSENVLYQGAHFYDFYRAKAMSYPNLITRPPFWTSYHQNLYPQYYNFYKRKGGQVRFTASQTDALEKRFTSHKYLSPEDRKLLADSLKLTDRQVKTWFQNRRAKWRRCNSLSSTEVSSSKYEENKCSFTCEKNKLRSSI